MLAKRKRGRPRTAPEPVAPSGPVVFLTRQQLAERWHTTPQTISRKYGKLGLRPVTMTGRWLVALAHVEELERKKMAAGN